VPDDVEIHAANPLAVASQVGGFDFIVGPTLADLFVLESVALASDSDLASAFAGLVSFFSSSADITKDVLTAIAMPAAAQRTDRRFVHFNSIIDASLAPFA
jgi:hypothetical protein